MRERLTFSFVALTLLLLLAVGFMRAYTTDDDLMAAEAADARATAEALADVVDAELADGGTVDRLLLAPFVTPRVELTYDDPVAADVVVTGAEYDGGDPVSARVAVDGGGALTVSRQPREDVAGLWGADTGPVLMLFALLALVAGVVGYLVARSLSAPFRQLAVAAAALGRGRFDLDLPRGGVPEARAIASALEQSATQLRERLARERDFGQHASHVLRTPLTGLRLRLEDLVEDPDLSPEAHAAAESCLTAVARLNDVTGELVEIGARGVLVAGAALPLRDLATQVAQRWADALDVDDRRLTAAVEGDIELFFTPGPVEQVLDLLLLDVATHETGSVRLVFEGAASRLQVDVLCSRPDGSRGAPRHPVEDKVQALLDAVGGRLERPVDTDVLRLHLPRR